MARKRIPLATPLQPSPPLPDGGRAMGEGTGVRFRRAGHARSTGAPLPGGGGGVGEGGGGGGSGGGGGPPPPRLEYNPSRGGFEVCARSRAGRWVLPGGAQTAGLAEQGRSGYTVRPAG